MEKKEYTPVKMEIIEFEAEDIIATSIIYEDDETKLIKYLYQSISADSSKLSADIFDRKKCSMMQGSLTVLSPALQHSGFAVKQKQPPSAYCKRRLWRPH